MNIDKLFLTVLFTILSAGNLSAQWVKLNTDSLHGYLAIDFLNSDTGFISGTYNPFTQDGVILRTIDGGDNWDTTIIVAGGFLMDIQFINDSMGFAGGQDGNLYWTNDMGDSWTYYGNCQSLNDITNFYFFESDSALILGVSGGLALLDPPNCINLLNNAAWTTFPGTGTLDFISPEFGYLAGGDGIFLISSDSGSSWTNFNCDSNLFILGATMADTNKVIVVGQHGKVSVSDNGGSFWSAPDSISHHDILDVDFLNLNTGYCVGGKVNWSPNVIGNGTIWVSQDGGATWAIDDSSYSNQLIDVLIVNDSLSFAVGYSGLLLRNKINLSTAGSIEVPKDINVNIYPNPFSNSLSITLPEILNFSFNLSIKDLTGRIIYSSEFLTGKTMMNIDTGSWLTGIYILKLESENSLLVRKLIRME